MANYYPYDFGGTGVLDSLVVVPEPRAGMLLWLGATGLAIRRSIAALRSLS
ncbi:MAG: hypothetical protein WEF50_08325 [Myxococcota bacterium]